MKIKDVKMLLNKGVSRVKIAKKIGIKSNNDTKGWFESAIGKVDDFIVEGKAPKSERYKKAKEIINTNPGLERKEIASMIMRGIGASSSMAYSYIRSYENEKRSEEHTSELQSRGHLVCRLLL